MKKRMLIVGAVFGVVVLLATLGVSLVSAGNGAPSGAHYNLNIIGVPKEKTADMTDNNGHRIFVPLVGKTSISLIEGDFQVLDANGTDGKASFQLPAPDPDGDGITAYSVYARALGKPNGMSTTTPYIIDEYGNTWYSTESMILIRDKGKPTFQNVTAELLYLYGIWIDTDGDGAVDTYYAKLPLFGDATLDYFWEYDNSGLKLAQLRFYEIPTDTN